MAATAAAAAMMVEIRENVPVVITTMRQCIKTKCMARVFAVSRLCLCQPSATCMRHWNGKHKHFQIVRAAPVAKYHTGSSVLLANDFVSFVFVTRLCHCIYSTVLIHVAPIRSILGLFFAFCVQNWTSFRIMFNKWMLTAASVSCGFLVVSCHCIKSTPFQVPSGNCNTAALVKLKNGQKWKYSCHVDRYDLRNFNLIHSQLQRYLALSRSTYSHVTFKVSQLNSWFIQIDQLYTIERKMSGKR